MATILAGKTTVTTAGTGVALGSAVVNGALAVKALLANTNNIYVGGATVDKTAKNGFELDAGEVVVFEFVGSLADIWIDADTNGEGVSYCALSGPVQ